MISCLVPKFSSQKSSIPIQPLISNANDWASASTSIHRTLGQFPWHFQSIEKKSELILLLAQLHTNVTEEYFLYRVRDTYRRKTDIAELLLVELKSENGPLQTSTPKYFAKTALAQIQRSNGSSLIRTFDDEFKMPASLSELYELLPTLVAAEEILSTTCEIIRSEFDVGDHVEQSARQAIYTFSQRGLIAGTDDGIVTGHTCDPRPVFYIGAEELVEKDALEQLSEKSKSVGFQPKLNFILPFPQGKDDLSAFLDNVKRSCFSLADEVALVFELTAEAKLEPADLLELEDCLARHQRLFDISFSIHASITEAESSEQNKSLLNSLSLLSTQLAIGAVVSAGTPQAALETIRVLNDTSTSAINLHCDFDEISSLETLNTTLESEEVEGAEALLLRAYYLSSLVSRLRCLGHQTYTMTRSKLFKGCVLCHQNNANLLSEQGLLTQAQHIHTRLLDNTIAVEEVEAASFPLVVKNYCL